MTDHDVYNSVTEIPDDVLKNDIRITEENIAAMKLYIQRRKDELARRQPDSLYATNLNGTVELVDDMGEVR